MENDKVVHTRSGSLSAEAAGKIIDELAEASDEAEILDRIRHELKLANAIKLMEMRLAHSVRQESLSEYINDAMNVVDMH